MTRGVELGSKGCKRFACAPLELATNIVAGGYLPASLRDLRGRGFARAFPALPLPCRRASCVRG
jgi:hypothetical protein